MLPVGDAKHEQASSGVCECHRRPASEAVARAVICPRAPPGATAAVTPISAALVWPARRQRVADPPRLYSIPGLRECQSVPFWNACATLRILSSAKRSPMSVVVRGISVGLSESGLRTPKS